MKDNPDSRGVLLLKKQSLLAKGIMALILTIMNFNIKEINNDNPD
ncbi:hypothetical protein QY890_01935 [Latilactobacillus sakei]